MVRTRKNIYKRGGWNYLFMLMFEGDDICLIVFRLGCLWAVWRIVCSQDASACCVPHISPMHNRPPQKSTWAFFVPLVCSSKNPFVKCCVFMTNRSVTKACLHLASLVWTSNVSFLFHKGILGLTYETSLHSEAPRHTTQWSYKTLLPILWLRL